MNFATNTSFDIIESLKALEEYAEERIFQPYYPSVVWVMRQQQFDRMVKDGSIRWLLGPEENSNEIVRD